MSEFLLTVIVHRPNGIALFAKSGLGSGDPRRARGGDEEISGEFGRSARFTIIFRDGL